MERRIIVDPNLCDGCGICQLICAFEKEKVWHPSAARILLTQSEDNSWIHPVVCQHCDSPPCAVFCVMNLISKDDRNDCTIREETRCIGCRACEAVCPFSAAVWMEDRGVVVHCDLCGGQPQCVKYCPSGALQYYTPEEANARRRYHIAGSRAVEVQSAMPGARGEKR